METKFRLHDKDRGNPFADDLSFAFLSERFDMEWDEFMTDLGDNFRLDTDIVDGKSPVEVFREGADCCNFILMMCIKYEADYIRNYSKSPK